MVKSLVSLPSTPFALFNIPTAQPGWKMQPCSRTRMPLKGLHCSGGSNVSMSQEMKQPGRANKRGGINSSDKIIELTIFVPHFLFSALMIYWITNGAVLG